MAHTPFRVEVLTPEGSVFDEEVEFVSTRTEIGSRWRGSSVTIGENMEGSKGEGRLMLQLSRLAKVAPMRQPRQSQANTPPVAVWLTALGDPQKGAPAALVAARAA